MSLISLPDTRLLEKIEYLLSTPLQEFIVLIFLGTTNLQLFIKTSAQNLSSSVNQLFLLVLIVLVIINSSSNCAVGCPSLSHCRDREAILLLLFYCKKLMVGKMGSHSFSSRPCRNMMLLDQCDRILNGTWYQHHCIENTMDSPIFAKKLKAIVSSYALYL